MFSVKFVSGHVHSLLSFFLFLFSVFLHLFSALSGKIGTWIGTHFLEEPKFLSKMLKITERMVDRHTVTGDVAQKLLHCTLVTLLYL